MTDNNENKTPSAEDLKAQADKKSRNAAARNKVVRYSDADEGMQEEMRKLMVDIDNDPTSFEAIVAYGSEPLIELGVAADRILSLQKTFGDQLNVMKTRSEKMQEKIKGFDFPTMLAAMKSASGAVVDKGAKGLGAFFGFVKKEKKDESQKLLEEMQDRIPEMMKDIEDLIADVEDAEKGMEEVMKAAQELGKARYEALRKINLYIGAGEEITRRYDQEYIPDAQADFDESQDPEDKMLLDSVISARRDFINHLTLLEGSRLQSATTMQSLLETIEILKDQRKKMKETIYSGQHEWKAIMGSTSLAANTLKAAKLNEKSDKMGDEIFTIGTDMVEKAHGLTLESRGRGTVSIDKMVEAADRFAKMIEAKAKHEEEASQRLLKAAGAARAATDRILEAAEARDKKQLLEATKNAEASIKAAEEEKLKKAGGPANDDKKGTTPRAPRRREGNGPSGL